MEHDLLVRVIWLVLLELSFGRRIFYSASLACYSCQKHFNLHVIKSNSHLNQFRRSLILTILMIGLLNSQWTDDIVTVVERRQMVAVTLHLSADCREQEDRDAMQFKARHCVSSQTTRQWRSQNVAKILIFIIIIYLLINDDDETYLPILHHHSPNDGLR